MTHLAERIQILIESKDLLLADHPPHERCLLPSWWRGHIMDVRSELDSTWDAVASIVQRCDERIRELIVYLLREEPSSEPATSPSSESTTSLSLAVKKRAGESQDDGTQKRSKTMREVSAADPARLAAAAAKANATTVVLVGALAGGKGSAAGILN